MFVTRTMLQFPPAESKTQKVHEPCWFSAKTFLWGWWQWSVTIWALGSPQNSYIEVLVPKVMAFGGGACRKWLSLDEVMRVEPHDRISALKRTEREQRSVSLWSFSFLSLSLSVMWIHKEKAAIYRSGRQFSPGTIPAGPWSGTSSLKGEKQMSA